MAKIQVTATPIPDLVIIEPTVFGDERGFFMETYNKAEFAANGLGMEFVQDNHSKSGKGVLRGLHYQTEHVQGKLVRVIRGGVWDVAVDLRKGGATFGKWFGVTLSAANKKMFYVPEGFAHGFLTLEDETEVIYKCTDYYDPEHETGLRFDDPDLNIVWPLAEYGLSKADLILSAKDERLPMWREFVGMGRR